jgi:hypothetical protein
MNRVGHAVGEGGRQEQPAEAKHGRERLAHRAGIADVVGGHALERGDRMAVIAELRVVVVLDDHRCLLDRPGEQPGAPVGGEHDAGRELMRRRRDHGIDAHAIEAVDYEPALVDGDRDRVQSSQTHRARVMRPRRVLNADAPCAAATQDLERDCEPVREARCHDNVIGCSGLCPRAREVVSQRSSQTGEPSAMRTEQVGVRQCAQGLTRRG